MLEDCEQVRWLECDVTGFAEAHCAPMGKYAMTWYNCGGFEDDRMMNNKGLRCEALQQDGNIFELREVRLGKD